MCRTETYYMPVAVRRPCLLIGEEKKDLLYEEEDDCLVKVVFLCDYVSGFFCVCAIYMTLFWDMFCFSAFCYVLHATCAW